MKQSVLVVNLIVVLAMVSIADDNAKALALLKGVEKERLKYDCFHIRYEEYWPDKELTIEQIIDFDRGKIRKEHIPNGSFLGLKSILLEDVVYSMMTYDDKHVAVMDSQAPKARGVGLYDPRMLGLDDMLDHHMDISSCLLYKNRSNFSVSRETLDGRSVYIVECHDGERNGFAHWKLYIEEPGFRLIKQTMEAQFGNIQIMNDYSEQKFLPFPTNTHIYRVRANGEVVSNRYITVKDVQIKKSFPPETFTLAGLKLPLNADVSDYRIQRRLGYWDGEKLVENPVSISAQELRELMQLPRRGWANYLFMGIGIVLILWGLYRAMNRKTTGT